MATHSSVLAWRIPCTEEPGGLQSWGRKEPDTTEELTLSLPYLYMHPNTMRELLFLFTPRKCNVQEMKLEA